MERIPVAGPWITDREVDYVADAARNDWYSAAGGYNRRFEKAFAAAIGVAHAVSLPSCTSAIHLSLAALGIGPGDEVVVPDLTWIATAAPIRYVGAEPVFADVDPVSWCLSPMDLERCIGPRTRAVIVVDLYGNMPDMAAILDVAARHGIPMVEDAAEAVGSEYAGKRAGSFGRTGVFSFHGSKTLTTGEGGMLVTDDPILLERVLLLRDHGRRPGDVQFYNDEVAFKYKMSGVQAALGLAQTERLDELVERKRQIFSWYAEELAGQDGVVLNPEPPRVRNSYWMVTIVLDPGLGLTKQRLMARLAEAGMDTRPFFHPLSSLPAFAESHDAARAARENAAAYALSPYGVNLPSALCLTREQVAQVGGQLRAILDEARRGRGGA